MTLATDHIPQTAPVADRAGPACRRRRGRTGATHRPDPEAPIADAVWTDLLWLMPPDRTVTVTVHGGNVSVELGPPDRAAFPASH